MADEIVETSSKSWGSRLMDSIKNVLLGLLLFLAAFPLLWWNEGRAVQTAKSLTEGASSVVAVAADKVEAANEGKLIHLTGTATTTETLKDPDFGVSAQALGLARKVEMYQWVQHEKRETHKKIGGGEETVTTYSYSRDWRDEVVDSSSFKSPQGHENPTGMRYKSEKLKPTRVTLGAFVLSSGLLGQIHQSEPIAVTAEMLAGAAKEGSAEAAPAPAAKTVKGKKKAAPVVKHGAVAAKKGKPVPVAGHHAGAADTGELKIADGMIYVGGTPEAAEIGTLRISFSKTPIGEVSVVAAQSRDSLAPYQTKAGNALEMLRPGNLPAAVMFAQAQADNAILTWILRAVGLVLMLVGLMLVFGPLAVVADVLPFLGDMLRVGVFVMALPVALSLTLLTIALAWLFYRPVIGIALLATGAAALFGVRALASRKKVGGTITAEPSAQHS